MAVGAEEIALVPVPIPGPAAVDAGPPVSVFLPVALPAKAVGLLEEDGLPAGPVKQVPVVGIVAVQAPTVFFVMPEHDVRVKPRQLSPRWVHRHQAVAIGAGVDPGGEGWGRYL
jgi:hypothetical protein